MQVTRLCKCLQVTLSGYHSALRRKHKIYRYLGRCLGFELNFALFAKRGDQLCSLSNSVIFLSKRDDQAGTSTSSPCVRLHILNLFEGCVV